MVFAVKEGLDADGTTNADIIDRKTFRYKVFDQKVVQRKKRRKTKAVTVCSDDRSKRFRFLKSPFRKDETGEGAKISKTIETDLRCVSRGPIREYKLIESVKGNSCVQFRSQKWWLIEVYLLKYKM